jgi:hypothetical protein
MSGTGDAATAGLGDGTGDGDGSRPGTIDGRAG